ncbi:glycosyltransferase family 4 protein [Winogradskyella wichelsiae]|uniref:glycosyltransferase family 4 protein n=1 Tax=Winogradskyella wichelsiae TaxID=2697007 RepID=UPI003EF991DB
MHICFITNEFPKAGFPHGGIGTFIATISKALVERGVKVSVVGKNYTPNAVTEVINGIEIYRLHAKSIKGLAWYFNTRVIAKKIEAIHSKTPIDIVEASDMGLAFLPKLKGIAYVIRMHGGHHFFAESEQRKVGLWKGLQEKWSYKKAEAFIAVSDYVKTHTSKYLSLEHRQVQRINYPINLQHFQPIAKPHVPFKIVFAGTVCEKKGIRQLIQAMTFVLEQFPEATLDVYGRDWTYPNGDSYITRLKTLELPQLKHHEDRVNFKGIVDYDILPEKYAEAHVCVFPSHMETLGLVAPEAMCMTKPVVFTKEGPGPEVVTHGVTGLLCDPYNPKDIANQIKWVFQHPEAAIKLGDNARKSVIERFNIDKIAEQNMAFYKTIVKPKGL